MASQKGAHYHQALAHALTAGAWSHAAPATTPRAAPLSWPELVRKWGKHTQHNTALVHRLRDISLLYLASTGRPSHSRPFLAPPRPGPHPSPSPPASAESESPTASSFVHVPRPHLRRRRPADDAPAAARPAAFLSAADLDGDDAQDQRAWSEGEAWWAAVPPDETSDGAGELEALLASGHLPPAERESAKLVLAYHLHAAGAHDAALRRYDTVDWATDARAGVVEGDAAVVDRLRARCLQGLCHELSSTPSPALALQAYLATVPLFHALAAPSFDACREACRFLATALFRAAILAARQPAGARAQTLAILRTFHACSASWPASFRPVQRQKMLVLYLRALLSPSPAPALPRQQWEKQVSLALTNGQALLEQSTTFPRAGSVNHPVVLFAQLAVQLYTLLPRSRALSDQVVGLLWWATTLTFQSQSILRALIRVLSDREEYSDAKRVFELYVGLVLKARQTAQPEIALQLQRRPTDDDAAHPAEIQRQASQATRTADPSPEADALVRQATSASHEADDDTDFVQTLLAGAKLLTEGMNEPEEAWRYACLAGDVVQVGKLAHNKELEASVEQVKGIVRMLMARNVTPHERANYQSQSLNHLAFSTTIAPTPTSLYHLAHAYAQARKIPQAIDAIRKSLEMDEKNVEAWHLLGILLTSMRDWEAARKAVEAGWRVWEETDENERRMEEGVEDGAAAQDLMATRPEISSKDFAAPFTDTAASSPLVLPTGAFPPLPPLPASPPTSSYRLAQVIRLRMTLNMIIEKTMGCEEAMVRQQDLFAFFSARCSLAVANRQPQSGAAGGEKKEVPDREEGLGESFVNIKEQEKDSPIPITATSPDGIPTLATPIPPTPTSLDPAPLPTEVQMINENTLTPFRSVSEKGRRRRSLSLSLRSKSSKPKNQLGVLPARGGGGGRTASLRGAVLSGEMEKATDYGGLQPLALVGANPRGRTVSHSTAPSIVPTAIHSHYRSSRARPFPSPPPAPPPPSAPSKPSPLDNRSPQEKRILSDLWLASAATFRRWGKLEQCLVSVMEAEGLDPGNEDVWVQLGMYHVANTAMTMSSKASAGKEEEEDDDGEKERVWKPAEEAFSKSLLLKTDHPPALVSLAKLYLSTSTFQNLSTSTPTDHAPKRYQGADLAESLLNPFTQSIGWDIPEAWYLLGHVARVQGREERARECWEFALGLEQGRGIRDWSCLKRWL